MATKTPRTTRVDQNGFDVTCVIGRVTFGDGEESAHVAAFKLIAEHDAPGVYTFPANNGGDVVVTVDYTDDQKIEHYES